MRTLVILGLVWLSYHASATSPSPAVQTSSGKRGHGSHNYPVANDSWISARSATAPAGNFPGNFPVNFVSNFVGNSAVNTGGSLSSTSTSVGTSSGTSTASFTGVSSAAGAKAPHDVAGTLFPGQLADRRTGGLGSLVVVDGEKQRL